jgi:hypothetical protein
MRHLYSAKPTTVLQVYTQIQKYCVARCVIGGSYTQEPYKFDFFNIFHNAYRN